MLTSQLVCSSQLASTAWRKELVSPALGLVTTVAKYSRPSRTALAGHATIQPEVAVSSLERQPDREPTRAQYLRVARA